MRARCWLWLIVNGFLRWPGASILKSGSCGTGSINTITTASRDSMTVELRGIGPAWSCTTGMGQATGSGRSMPRGPDLLPCSSDESEAYAENVLAAKTLPVRIFHPTSHHFLIAQIKCLLQIMQTDHQTCADRRHAVINAKHRLKHSSKRNHSICSDCLTIGWA